MQLRSQEGGRKEDKISFRYQAQIFTNRHYWFREMSRPRLGVFIAVSVGSCGMCPQYPVMSMFHVNNEASHLFTCSVQNLRVSYKYGNIHLFTPFHYI